MVAAGLLNKRVILQTRTSTVDDGGGNTEAWADTVTLWARVSPLTGRERYAAQQVQSGISTEVEIRHRAGVVPQQRFKYGARLFYVQSVIDRDERNETLVCICEERNV